MDDQSYFESRKISPEFYTNFKIPSYLKNVLPEEKSTLFLDIGCGFGQILSELRDSGYVNLFGIDIDQNAVQFCLKNYQ